MDSCWSVQLCAHRAARLQGNKRRGREKGNGRIVLSKLDDSEPGCVWKYERMIEVPKSANFNDFSDIDIEGQGTNARVIISSQEDAAVWIGRINTETFEFQDVGAVLHFPRMGPDCEAQYCNIEGVAFIDECAPQVSVCAADVGVHLPSYGACSRFAQATHTCTVPVPVLVRACAEGIRSGRGERACRRCADAARCWVQRAHHDDHRPR